MHPCGVCRELIAIQSLCSVLGGFTKDVVASQVS